jgi:hypothetical protein
MRTVLVASSVSNKAKRVETSATTWEEFQGEISDLLTSGVDAIVKPGNYTLRNDSTLPEGDFKLFLIPTKNKSGYFDIDDIKDAVVDLIDDAFEKYGDQIVDIIKNALSGESTSETAGEDEELEAALQEARELE